MKRIVIFYPKLEPEKKWHYVPYAALCVASVYHAMGREVIIVDDRIVENSRVELLKALDCHQSDVELLMSVYTGYQVTRAYEMSKFVKAVCPWVKIIWGGPHVTCFPEKKYFDENIDYIYPGYAEHGEYDMPWELVNLSDYINPETKRFIYISTYGCPGVCSFCATKNKRKWIELPMSKVREDIRRLMKLYPAYRECVFFDATIFTRPQRVFELAGIMLEHNLKWIADARADEIIRMPTAYMDYIMESGVTQLTIGLESGSQRIVDMMKKGVGHLRKYETCANIMSKYDIKMCSGVIFGCPGETPEDLKQTIEYVKKIKKINPNFYISTTFFMPLPNTEMAEMAKAYGYREPEGVKEWAQYGERGHFHYNSWMDNPWIQDKEEYKKIYDAFIEECDFLI